MTATYLHFTRKLMRWSTPRQQTLSWSLNHVSLLRSTHPVGAALIHLHPLCALFTFESLSTLNCFEMHQLWGKYISHNNKVNIGSSGTHDAWVVYPWFSAPDPVCLLFSSKLRAFTFLPSTNYFFKGGCRQTQPGWLFLTINILKATIVHFSWDFIRHPQRLNRQTEGEGEKDGTRAKGGKDASKGTEWGRKVEEKEKVSDDIEKPKQRESEMAKSKKRREM